MGSFMSLNAPVALALDFSLHYLSILTLMQSSTHHFKYERNSGHFSPHEFD